MFFPDDLYYHKEHFGRKLWITLWSWAGMILLKIGPAKSFMLNYPLKGKVLEQGKPCGSMESGKWVGRIYVPSPEKWKLRIEALEILLN